MRKVAIDARVSTASHATYNQLLELRVTAQRMAYTVVAEFVDNGISGAEGRADRPALDQMLKQAPQRKFDMSLSTTLPIRHRTQAGIVPYLCPRRETNPG